MVLLFSLSTDRFFTGINVTNIILNFSWIAIAAFGMTLVIISGGIDLSVGSVVGLAGVAAFVLWIDRLQIRPEERQLALIFGPDYPAYRRRVRRWL